MKGPSDLRIAKSLNLLNMIQSGLNRLVFLAGDGSHLPEKENITSNQHSWPEKATQMGVKWNNKHTNSKVNSTLIAQHIGKPNYKCTTNDNPYGAGKQSSKCAKPDTCFTAANVQACIAKE